MYKIDNSRVRINAEKEMDSSLNKLVKYLIKHSLTTKEIHTYLQNHIETYFAMYRDCDYRGHKIDKNIECCHICSEWLDKQVAHRKGVSNYEFVLKRPIKVQARSLEEAEEKLQDDYLVPDFNSDRLEAQDLKFTKISKPSVEDTTDYLEIEEEIYGDEED